MDSFARGKRYFLDHIVSTSVFTYIETYVYVRIIQFVSSLLTAHTNVRYKMHDDFAERVVAFRAWSAIYLLFTEQNEIK